MNKQIKEIEDKILLEQEKFKSINDTIRDLNIQKNLLKRTVDLAIDKILLEQEKFKSINDTIRDLNIQKNLLKRTVDLATINSSIFIESLKKINFRLYLDENNPKLFSEDEKFESIIEQVKYNLNYVKDDQIYLKENVYFLSLYNRIEIHSESIKDLLKFAKKHKLKWYNLTIQILNEEILEQESELKKMKKIKSIINKYNEK